MNRRKLLQSAAGMTVAVAMDHALADSVTDSSATSLASSLAHDPRRPQFHLLPVANWMNDPNGPIYWNGRYHMFFQYNPNGAYWGDMHWAHAESADMVHWKHLPIALAPTAGGPDAAGCFSGTAVATEHGVALIYTGIESARVPNQHTSVGTRRRFHESQCVATSTDPELKTWTKLQRPVIAAPPEGLEVTGFRDPSPWRRSDWWYLAVGSGTRRQGGAVLLYRSKDLKNWEYLHPLASGPGSGQDTEDPVGAGDMWECPDFFPLGEKHVLIYSTIGAVHWQSGVLDEREMRFHTEHSGILDHGAYYAAKSQLDAQGNRIVWGWVRETRPLAEYKAAGWAGMMSLPRSLGLADDGGLRMEFAPAVRVLRRRARNLDPSSNASPQLDQLVIEGGTGEFLGSFRRGDESFTINLVGMLPTRSRSDLLLTLRYDPASPSQVLVDGQPIPVRGAQNGPLELHLYADGSVLEALLQRSAAYTKRFYYPGSAAPRVKIRFEGPPSYIERLSVWQMESISTNRLARS